MSDQVTLQGALSAGPQAVCEGSPSSGTLQITFGLGGAGGSCGFGSKPAPRKSWQSLDLASPGAYVAVDGIGPGGVSAANFLWIRTSAAMVVRLTFANPAGGADIVSVIPVHGLTIVEPSAAGYLKGLEVQGAGRFEFFASGNA